MPQIKLKYVISASSQDPKQPAENLLTSGGNKKWLCGREERKGYLEGVFQLERSCIISHLDIGAYWAMTVQVQVGRSTWPPGNEYKTLLPAHTFMSPAECKNGQNVTKLRMFKTEDFSEAVSSESWDRLKIVCSQPFRKDVQLGLCLVRVIAEDTPDEKKEDKQNQLKDAPDNIEAIKEHFFGKNTSERSPSSSTHQFKMKLNKIGLTGDNQCGDSLELSRTAKMVLAGMNTSPRFRVTAGSTTARTTQEIHNSGRTFEVEVSEFLEQLDLSNIDLDKMTYADLRHKLEKEKCRKLSKDEKKIFLNLTSKFIDTFSEGHESEDLNKNNKLKTGTPKKTSTSQTKVDSRDKSAHDKVASRTPPRTPKGVMNEKYKLASPTKLKPDFSKRSKIIQQNSAGSSPVHKLKDHNEKYTKMKSVLCDGNSEVLGGELSTNAKSVKERRKSGETGVKSNRKMLKVRRKTGELNLGETLPDIVARGKADLLKIKEQMSEAITITGAARKNTRKRRKTEPQQPAVPTNDVWLNAKTPPPSQPKPRARSKTTPARNKSCASPLLDDVSSTSPGISAPSTDMPVCPVCERQVPLFDLEEHAAECASKAFDVRADLTSGGASWNQASTSVPSFDSFVEPDLYMECPVCGRLFPDSAIEVHANQCADRSQSILV